MARIALIAGAAIAGAVISVATGGLGAFPVGAWITDIVAGAAVGASVGNMLSNIIFPPHANSAPPMNDLQSMSSAYGSPIPWGYGGYRIAGQVIWAQTIKVHKNQQKTGGKGGGPTSTVYTYTISCAISFGFGPGSVIRIWADSKLIYDKSSKGPVAIDTGLSTSNGNAITTPFEPVFYTGTATQLPDPTIQAAVGIASTSGYRDQIYMVLHDFPLSDYGNRLPNFRAEISSSTGLSYVKDIYPESLLAGHSGLLAPGFTHIDPVNRAGYTLNAAGEVMQKIDIDVATGNPATPWAHAVAYVIGNQVLDINGNIQYCIRNHTSQSSGQPTWQTGEMQFTAVSSTNTWQNQGPGPDVAPIVKEIALVWPNSQPAIANVTSTGFASGPDTAGNFWLPGWTSSGWNMLRFNSQTFVNDRVINTPGSGGPFVMYSFTKMKSSNTGKNYLYAIGKEAQAFWILDAAAGSVLHRGSWLYPALPVGGGIAFGGHSPCAIDPVTGIAYLVLHISPGVTGIISMDFASGISELVWSTSFSYTAFSGGVNDEGEGILWDATDSTLLVITNQGALLKLSSVDGSILASTGEGVVNDGLAAMMSRAYDCLVPTTGVIALPDGAQNLKFIRTSDLTVMSTVALSNWLPAILSHEISWMAYDALTNALFVVAPASSYGAFSMRIFLDRQQVAEEDLQTVIEDIWSRTGADPSFLDASAMAGTMVKGYPITQQSTGKGLLGPLQAAFFFDLVETDNVLKAVPRGQPVTTIIPEDDLGLLSDNYEANPTIIQEHDLPIFININYYDKARDYQQGKQTYRRSKRVRKTRNKTEINLPLTMTADDAAVIAAKCLQTAWAERNQWEFKLWRMSYLTMDPTDVVQFTYNGALYQSRVGKTSVGANKVIEVTAVSEDPKQYVSTTIGADGLFNSGTISTVTPSALFILDIPFLSDGDANPTSTTGYYWSMASAIGSSRWPGGLLYDSSDNNTFAPVNTDNSAVTFGYVGTATPPPASLFVWDRTTVINVSVQNGASLTSASELAVLNGANTFYLGSGSGFGEVAAFASATLQSDGSYNLSTLLRGLRGTEGKCRKHVANEVFVLLDVAQQRQVQPTTVIGATQYFRGITLGQPLTSSASVPTVLVANDLKPYAPAQFNGVKSGSDISMTWERRTRLGGAWLDGTGTVPLSEETENYELDIMQLNLQGRTTDPTYSAVPTLTGVSATLPLVTTVFLLGAATFSLRVQPFTITWEDGTVASYKGIDIPTSTIGPASVDAIAQIAPTLVWVHDPSRAGDVNGGSVAYGADAQAFADNSLANTPGYYLIGIIPAFVIGAPISTYVTGVDGGDIPVRSRTLSTNSYLYTSAQMVADFGRNEVTAAGAPGSVRAKVYQVSTSVGKGFGAENFDIGKGIPRSGA